MFEKSNRWLEVADKNKTLVILWGAFVACSTFALNDSAGLADKRVALRDSAAAIEGLQTERSNFQQMVSIWQHCLQDLADHASSNLAKLTPDQLAPDHLRATNKWLMGDLQSDRQGISVAMGKINNLYFSLTSNQDLRTKLLADLSAADEILQRRIQFAQFILTDMKKAREMAPTIRTDIGEQRKVLETEKRWDYIKQVDDEEVLEFNTRVRNYNEQRRVYDSGVEKTVGAWAFVGMCIGGLLGAFVHKWRVRKKGSKVAVAPPADPGDWA